MQHKCPDCKQVKDSIEFYRFQTKGTDKTRRNCYCNPCWRKRHDEKWVTVSFVCTHSFREQVREAANDPGITISTFTRGLASAYLEADKAGGK